MEKFWLQSYPAGVPHDVDPGQYSSLAQLLEESFRKNATQPFSVCMERWMSYRQLDELSAALGAWLQRLGLEPGAQREFRTQLRFGLGQLVAAAEIAERRFGLGRADDGFLEPPLDHRALAPHPITTERVDALANGLDIGARQPLGQLRVMRARGDFEDAAGERMHVHVAVERPFGLGVVGVAAWTNQPEAGDHRVADFAAATDRQIQVDWGLRVAEQCRKALELAARCAHRRTEPDRAAILRHDLGAGYVRLRKNTENGEQHSEHSIRDPPIAGIVPQRHEAAPDRHRAAQFSSAAMVAAPVSPPNRLLVTSRIRAQNSPRLESIGT